MKPASTITEKIRHSLHLERSLRLVWQSAPGWTAANFGLILIQDLLPLVSLYLMNLIVDAVTSRTRISLSWQDQKLSNFQEKF